MEMIFVIVVLSLAVLGMIIMFPLLFLKESHRPTPDFKTIKKDVRASFSVNGSVTEIRQKILSMPRLTLMPGLLEVKEDTIITFSQFMQPGNYYVFYLSPQEGNKTLVEIGVFSAYNFPMFTMPFFLGKQFKDYLSV